MALVMSMMHGRHHPDEQLDDWGFHGPVFRVAWVHFTYMTTLTVGFDSADDYEIARELTGWESFDHNILEMRLADDRDLLAARDENGAPAFYGDWDVGGDERSAPAAQVWYDRAKALMRLGHSNGVRAGLLDI